MQNLCITSLRAYLNHPGKITVRTAPQAWKHGGKWWYKEKPRHCALISYWIQFPRTHRAFQRGSQLRPMTFPFYHPAEPQWPDDTPTRCNVCDETRRNTAPL